jgi:hypothetical protein
MNPCDLSWVTYSSTYLMHVEFEGVRMADVQGTPEGWSRRAFLNRVGMVGGAAAVYGAMEGLGLIASPANAETVDFVPPQAGEVPRK